MPDLTALAARWDAALNGALLQDAQVGYLLLTTLRVLVAWAAWRALQALGRWLAVALPPPRTPANVLYWARWWVWLRLREYAPLKVGVTASAVLLVLQIPAGVRGVRNVLTPASLGFSLALLLLLIGLAQLLNSLARRIAHPADP
ncbi:hypothetical protein DAERI_060093 [Deinococcus aerius]|uniref:Uncharacterized protein n=1 Tax=Deinococcus aerius TaxID=200253 RepID=A0A2I9CV96_9DEIO|nr:hypothetical protein [Deinococcus aerius]GBF05833.1 hypothetical protein DAERI_060093 [Deinococcus aerius]